MGKIEDNKQEIIRLYFEEKKSMSYIAKQFDVDKTGISILFKRENLKARTHGEGIRKYQVNENYFDNIDTPNKAYILGFLYADGYNNPITKSMVLDLKDIDKEILEKISKELGNTRPLYFYTSINKTDKKERHNCRLTISNKHIHEQLLKLGVIPNKTFILSFPDFIPDNLMSHFIRGYFDGDGCFSYSNKTNRSYITICSSDIFCEELASFLKEKENITLHVNNISNKNEKTKIARTSSKKEIINFLKYIYRDSDLKLERKYKKAIEFLNN